MNQNEDNNKLDDGEMILNVNLLRRHLRDASNPFTLPPDQFILLYRMPAELVLMLINEVQPMFVRERNSAIPTHLIVLSMIRFFAEGSFQRGFSQDFHHPMSQPSASKYLTKFVNAILQLSPRYVNFAMTAKERQEISRRFQENIRIPGIIGLIDGFIVKMKRPFENEEAFFHYRHGPAMNVQIIADCNYIIRSVRIVPGSNNDQFNWNYSQAKEYMEHFRNNVNEGPYYLLGDSGYARSPVLLTPLLNEPEGSPGYIYTQEHARTRCQVERTIGILSGVWKVISRSRTLYYKPQKVAKIINAAVILHNFRKLHRVQDEIVNDNIIVENNADFNLYNGQMEMDNLLRLYYN